MDEPLLDIDDIQANIVPGFRLPQQQLVFVRAADAAAATRLVSTLAGDVTTASEAIAFHDQRYQLARTANRFGSRSFAALASPVWLNIGLAAPLLDRLGVHAPTTADHSFELGLHRRSATLGDPKTTNHPGHRDHWLVGGPDTTADAVLIVGASDAAILDSRVDTLRQQVTAAGCAVVHEDHGRRLDGDTEHFGFHDGVSQPAVRGLVSRNPDRFLTPRRMDNPTSGPEQASPGRPLVWPGEFLFGYPRQHPSDFRQPSPAGAVDPFIRNGSFLVVRRLRQDVAGFRRETDRMAAELATDPTFADITPETFRAALVGRWRDGSPLIRHPNGPPTGAPDHDEINYFTYGETVPHVDVRPPKTVAGAPGDPNGLVCPFHAHIRKVNPRDRPTDLGAETNTMTLRILRRGIPYGPPMGDTPDDIDRGLLFLCYQTSIRDQFEQLTAKWVNSQINPEAGLVEGFDMIIGQNGGDPDRTRFCVFTTATTQATVSTRTDWVIPTGGGYFFCPSLSSLTQLSART